MFRFSIRDLLLATALAALVLGWWLDRTMLSARAKKAESFRTLSEALTTQLRNKNLASNIQIIVIGDVVRLREAPDSSLFARYPSKP